jgi:hypothetical protein
MSSLLIGTSVRCLRRRSFLNPIPSEHGSPSCTPLSTVSGSPRGGTLRGERVVWGIVGVKPPARGADSGSGESGSFVGARLREKAFLS